MSYGVRTWSGSGVLEMDTDTFTYQVLHSQTYSLQYAQVLVVPISGFDPATCVASILPVNPPTTDFTKDGLPYVSVASGAVTIRSIHPQETLPSGKPGSELVFRLLVMRYRN